MIDVVIVGGGLAGLVNSILLNRAGLEVLLIEKKSYPFHRVCGEYISNEVIPFLESHGLFPEALNPSRISQFQLTSVSGKEIRMPLDLGAFGVSRYALDHFLYKIATKEGVAIQEGKRVDEIRFEGGFFDVLCPDGEKFQSRLLIGSYGKRSRLDKWLDRTFIKRRSPYVGVKYHASTRHPQDLISLHNFPGGYCGISLVEDGISNICYLTERRAVREAGSIEALEKRNLSQNPQLGQIMKEAEFIFEKPLVINEISFETKSAVENHILMSGDAAGMIAPLCGNGMAMAIHSAKICSENVIKHYSGKTFDREALERDYTQEWQRLFAQRLWTGRNVQKLFGNPLVSDVAVTAVRSIPPLARAVMKRTHGEYF